MHRFQLLDEDGSYHGTLLSDRLTWRPGDLIPRGLGNLEVVRLVADEDSDQRNGYLIVRPQGADLHERTSIGERTG